MALSQYQITNWVFLTLHLSALFFSAAAYAHPTKYDALVCKETFQNNATLFERWRWRGHVVNFDENLFKNDTAATRIVVSYEGVVRYCGTFAGLYSWATVSDTLTTWTLPLFGLIVQMPWESNKFWATVGLLFRWIGSPVSSLMCVLWNISITGKCATLADMGMDSYTDSLEDPKSRASLCRDSFSILATMNQYELSYSMEPEMSEERLMNLVMEALFDINNEWLILKRIELAEEVRRTRRRGIVPVLLSFVWYLFAIAISVYKAFGSVGDSTVAHNLALGLLVGWLPCLVVASIVDRNPTDSDKMREHLNEFMRLVQLPHESFEVFAGFAGQGRNRWHYGIAHSVLALMEIRSEGDNTRPVDWFTLGFPEKQYYPSSPPAYVEYSDARVLLNFDWRELAQTISAAVVVLSSCLGALTISFFTPTVGFGCRSFTYLIYCATCLFSMIGEVCLYTFVRRPLRRPQPTQMWIIRKFLRTSSFRWCAERFYLVLDATSTGFLSYILFSQTTGAFNTTYCRASMIGGMFGGYIVLDTDDSVTIKRYFHVERYWLGGTTVALTFLCAMLAYLCQTWLTQSFLWSVDRSKAMRGLRRVRTWRALLKMFGYYNFGSGLRWSP